MRGPWAPIPGFRSDLHPRQGSLAIPTPTHLTTSPDTPSSPTSSTSSNGPTATSGTLSSLSTTSSASTATSSNTRSTSSSSSTVAESGTSTALSTTSSTSIIQTSQPTSTLSTFTTPDSSTLTSTSTTDEPTSLATPLSPASVTVTAVVTTSSGTSEAPFHTPSKGFFSSAGAVAGTFLVVGLFGTSLLLCLFFGARRKYRRRIGNRRLYDDDEYWQFNRSAELRGATLEPAMQDTSGSRPITPVHMVEGARSNEASLPFPSYHAVLQAEPGEFNPYHPRDAAYAFSTSEAHTQVAEDTTGSFIRRRSSEDRTTPENHTREMVARPFHQRSSSFTR